METVEISRAQVADLHKEWIRWFVDNPTPGQSPDLAARLAVWFMWSQWGVEHPMDEETGFPLLECHWCGTEGNPDLWR